MSIQNEQTPSPAARERSLSGHPTGVRDEVSVEAIILKVTQRVLREFADRGIQVIPSTGPALLPGPGIAVSNGASPVRSERADMTGYRTPVLIERHVRKLHELTEAVIVPRGTVVSPKAKELLRDKNIQLCIE
jgi:hypothetical protein